ncbi:CehA/McbA family metallohydrolase [Halorussus gelatinilyticus]|uniref:CehA/McbA family metallohydrolase n=1 Tax=Halorussus gelatinilyticus TaxID=2937524 RepID=A0A8U0IJ26_9EURY|nr:CehA/McbA family metallohydrolase [Halorussus gelatinilyticus]UPW01107.1 CehA/McbA family metallohydrolase [Halorussus gelatinilyticus]
MYAVDLHAHTRFFHGHERAADYYDPVGVRLLAGAAGLRGLDGVATTNHDYYRAFDFGGGRPGGSGRGKSGPYAATIPGIEVTTTHGHVLVVGPDPPTRTEPGDLSPEGAVELAHDRGCAAIVAHPYRNSTVREVDADFDAIEINGKHPRTEEWVRKLADRHDLPLVGGSDAHYPVEVGRAYTEIEADDLTPESVVAAIRDGRVRPRVNRSPFNRALRTLYRRVHEEKGYLQRPEWLDTPGVGKPPK